MVKRKDSQRPIILEGGWLPFGCYILMISVDSTAITIGRLNQGTPISFSPGLYLYIGSAFGKQGASSLPHRLYRHTCRITSPHHPIKDQLEAFFHAFDIHSFKCTKRLRWHIDYLLDIYHADIKGIFIIPGTVIDEALIVQKLSETKRFEIGVTGFGASDSSMSSHLLKFESDSIPAVLELLQTLSYPKS